GRRRGAGVAWSEEEEPDGDDQDDHGHDPEDHAHAVVVVVAGDDDRLVLVGHGLGSPWWLGVRVPPFRRGRFDGPALLRSGARWCPADRSAESRATLQNRCARITVRSVTQAIA